MVICPLTHTDKGLYDCVGERCAWFIEDVGVCAMVEVARQLRNIFKKTW
jgi:hypothetical protein